MSSDSLRATLYELEDQNYAAISQGKQFILGTMSISTILSLMAGQENLSVGFWMLFVAALIWLFVFGAQVWEWWKFRANTEMLSEWWEQRKA